MKLYDVLFEGAYVGSEWGLDEWGAIQKVVGADAYDDDGARDYRYRAWVSA